MMVLITLQDELQKNPELTNDDLQCLQEWNSKQPHLPTLTDLQLVLFLHSCHWSLERTKETIDSHYSIRTFAPELFTSLDPLGNNIRDALEVYQLSFLPNRDSEGNILFILRVHDMRISRFNLSTMMRLHIMAIMLSQHMEGTVPGFQFIYDMKDVGALHFAKVSGEISQMRKFIVFVQDALPLRLKGIHILNTNSWIDKMVVLVRPFVNSGLMSLVHFYGKDLEKFHVHVPKKLLPNDYGGEHPCMEELTGIFREQLEGHRELFLREEKMKSDESRRQGKAKDTGQLFGLEGSFKKLEID